MEQYIDWVVAHYKDITIGLLITDRVLKALLRGAKKTPYVWDEKVVEFMLGALNTIKQVIMSIMGIESSEPPKKISDKKKRLGKL